MELNFESNLEYQQDAIGSIVDLFNGQASDNSPFQLGGFYRTTTLDDYGKTASNIGIGNRLDLREDIILENIRKVQLKNEITPTDNINKSKLKFTVEMETGTGKTYVYLRSIFELNKNYGFTKFIIVVPSLAIKEGVKKTLDITRNHFKGLYDNPIYNYFVYNSSRLNDIHNFVVDNNINIMIINIDSFNKDLNLINQPQDTLQGNRPIDLIAQTNPFIIIDEPQSITAKKDGKGEQAIERLNPLCTVSFSATPPDNSENYIYKLNAVDAYNKKLVKQIEVDSILSHNDHNSPYMKLVEVKAKPYSAKIEIDANVKGVTKRKTVKVKNKTDLSDLSKREIYTGYIVDNIICSEGRESVEFTNGERIKLNLAVGETNEKLIKRELIHYTIKEHLDKELRLLKKGIKVLSLFFIDKVANYIIYDKEGNPNLGDYAVIFEEEYKKLIKEDKYKSLMEYNNINVDISQVHNGYFAQDKKGFKDTNGKGKLDNDAYNLIMKDKERLLNMKTPLRFIFSHSALREGWDNPNVFQICTLNETRSKMKKRQEIGRGLRLCVDQDGNRIKNNPNINILTVMANESYDQFAEGLQKEIEEDTGIKFNRITDTSFSFTKYTNRKGDEEELGDQKSKLIYKYLEANGYIKKDGKILPQLEIDIEKGEFKLAPIVEDIASDKEELRNNIINEIRTLTAPPIVKKRGDRKTIKLDYDKYKKEDFYKIWNKIKHKSMYKVQFDTERLIEECSKRLHEELNIGNPTVIFTKAGYKIEYSGIEPQEEIWDVIESQGDSVDLPNILQYLQNETTLTRKTLARILIQSETLNQFKKNPEEYKEQTLLIIKEELRRFLVDGIAYTKIEDCYDEDEFERHELFRYVNELGEDDKSERSYKSPYEYTIFDSGIEKSFQEKLEFSNLIKFYMKLPGWFEIDTPIGKYNPDWAILVEREGKEELYFIVETKGTSNIKELKPSEQYKIKCGIEHFKALDESIQFEVESDFEEFKMDTISKY